MGKIIRNIPNFITSMNLFSGCLSVIMALEGYLDYAVYFIFLGSLFDFIDGLAARALKAYSEIGAQLDSLSDVVSFGVAPSIIIFQLMRFMLFKDYHFISFQEVQFVEWVYLLIPFCIPIFAAVRLAKFNVDDRQSEGFLGLAVPANAIFFASLALVYYKMEYLQTYFENLSYLIFILIPLFSYLMISEIPMFSMKIKNLKWSDNKIRYIFIGLSAALLVLLKLGAMPFIILLYIALSMISSVTSKKI